MPLDAIHLGASNYPNSVEVDRRLVSRLFRGRRGQVTGFVVSAGTGLSVNITAGEAVVRGRSAAAQGAYYLSNPDASSVAWPASPLTGSRIDSLVLAVHDAQYGAAGPAMQDAQGPRWIVVTGSASAAPTDAAISTAVGAGGWERWLDVPVATNATTVDIASSTIRHGSAGDEEAGWTSRRARIARAAGWTIEVFRTRPVGVGIYLLEIDATRTGGTLTANADTGNMGNVEVGTVDDAVGLRPDSPTYLTGVVPGASRWGVTFGTGGPITITDGYPGATITGAFRIRGLVVPA